MTVRANWHLADLVVDDSDPFDEADVTVEGEEVDLTGPGFEGRIRELLSRESDLYSQGVTCSIKDRPDTCCSACPLRGTFKAHGRKDLCKLGTEQERAVMALRVADA